MKDECSKIVEEMKQKSLDEAKIRKLSKPKPGQKMGASDQGPPVYANEVQLSRLYDAMYNAQLAGLDASKVFGLDRNLAGEWNYSKWTYQPAK